MKICSDQPNQPIKILSAEVYYDFREQEQSAFLHEVAAHCGFAVAKDDSGKPLVVDKPLFVSLSHTRGLVVCAVSPLPVGIDVERVRPLQSFDKLSRRFLGKECRTAEEFLHEWTRYESRFKLDGAADIKSPDQALRFAAVEIDSRYICTLCQRG